MNNENSSRTPGGPKSFYIIYALPRVFREATGKHRFRETFRGASATAVPASAKVLELTSLTKLLLGVLIAAHLMSLNYNYNYVILCTYITMYMHFVFNGFSYLTLCFSEEPFQLFDLAARAQPEEGDYVLSSEYPPI